MCLGSNVRTHEAVWAVDVKKIHRVFRFQKSFLWVDHGPVHCSCVPVLLIEVWNDWLVHAVRVNAFMGREV